TFDPESERLPKFSADGKKVYFIRTDFNLVAAEGGGGFGGRASSGLFVVYLEKQDKDPTDTPATTAVRGGLGMGGGNPMMGADATPAIPAPPKEVKID